MSVEPPLPETLKCPAPCERTIPTSKLRRALQRRAALVCEKCGHEWPYAVLRSATDATVLPTHLGDITLDEARARLRDLLDKGTDCLCCGRFAKRYHRTLNAGAAYWLTLLVRLCPNDDYVNIAEIVRVASRRPGYSVSVSSGQAQTILPLWGLVETSHFGAGKGGASGDWRPTQRGRDFVAGRLTIPSHVVTYNNTFERFEGEPISIYEALGTRFDYDELMRGPLPGTKPVTVF